MNGTHLPPDIALLAALAQKSLLAEAARAGDIRPPSREDAARHEAGHAVGSALMGGGVRSCTVRQTRDGWIGQTVPAELPTWRIPLPSGGSFLTPPGAIARAVHLYAGPLAERQRGGGAGPANLANDVGEMMSALQVLRSAVLLAAFPGAMPQSEEAIEPLLPAIVAIDARFIPWLMGALRREIERVDAIAAKLVTHGRLASHELAPLLSGVVPITPEDLFDHLRQGLGVGPLPPTMPPPYLAAAATMGART